MKNTLVAFALLTLASLNVHAVVRPMLRGDVTHSQCASKIQAPGLKSVCISKIEGEKGEFITIADKDGNGEAYLILRESPAPTYHGGTDSVSTLLVQYTGSLVKGRYHPSLSVVFITMEIKKTVNVNDPYLIKALEGKFIRLGLIKASAFESIAYPQ